MAARAYWKGHLRLSLVSFPVQLVAAVTSSERIQFHQIHRASGERVKYQKVVPDVGPVENEDIAKGYEYERGRYVLVEPEELERLRVESRHTLDIARFVRLAELDPAYLDRPYFLLPDGEFAEDAYQVVREALAREGVAALGQVVLSGAEHVVAVRDHAGGMLLQTLRFPEQVRQAEEYFGKLRTTAVPEEQLQLALQIVRNKTGSFDPGQFEDHYQRALQELVRAKLTGVEPATVPERPAARVVNLMDALRRSVAQSAAAGAADGEGAQAAAPAPEAGDEARPRVQLRPLPAEEEASAAPATARRTSRARTGPKRGSGAG